MGRIGKDCVCEWVGLAKSVLETGQDWSRVFLLGVGIGQECSQEYLGLVFRSRQVKSMFGSGWDWSEVSSRVGVIHQDCILEKVSFQGIILKCVC